MATLRIHDSSNHALAFDLRDLVDLLAPHSLEASWTVAPVHLYDPASGGFLDEFMVSGPDRTGRTPTQLALIAANGSPVSGVAFSDAAHEALQVIWGEFAATRPACRDTWVTIRAIDSAFYELTTSDNVVLAKIKSAFKDVRVASGAAISIPIPRLARNDGEEKIPLPGKPVEITGRLGDAAVKSRLR